MRASRRVPKELPRLGRQDPCAGLLGAKSSQSADTPKLIARLNSSSLSFNCFLGLDRHGPLDAAPPRVPAARRRHGLDGAPDLLGQSGVDALLRHARFNADSRRGVAALWWTGFGLARDGVGFRYGHQNHAANVAAVSFLPDLTTAQTAAAILGAAAALLGILSLIFGWFGKAWVAIVSLFRPTSSGGRLLFFVDQLQGGYWAPATIEGRDGVQIHARLEASNMTDGAVRIMAARLRRRSATTTVIGVQDLRNGMYGHDYPIAVRQVVKVTVTFIFPTPAPVDPRKRLVERLILTDHTGRKHRLRLEFEGSQR